MQGSLLGFLHSVLSDIYSANHSIKKEKKVRQELIYSSTIKRFPNHFCPHTVQKSGSLVYLKSDTISFIRRNALLYWQKKPLLTTIERQYKSQLLLA